MFCLLLRPIDDLKNDIANLRGCGMLEVVGVNKPGYPILRYDGAQSAHDLAPWLRITLNMSFCLLTKPLLVEPWAMFLWACPELSADICFSVKQRSLSSNVVLRTLFTCSTFGSHGEYTSNIP